MDLVETAQALFRLACAYYLQADYTQALACVLRANSLERYNPHIEQVGGSEDVEKQGSVARVYVISEGLFSLFSADTFSFLSGIFGDGNL